MKKQLIFFAAAVALAFLGANFAQANPHKIPTDEWLRIKAGIKRKPPIEAKSRCGCPGMSTPRCSSGYKATGYTEVVDYMVTDAWGKADPGPEGYVALDSHTIVEDGVTCHDHIKATVCDPY